MADGTDLSTSHLDAFNALTEDEQRAHLRDTHGVKLIPASPGMWPERHAGLHQNSTVAKAHRLVGPLPQEYARLLNEHVERNVERVRRGGLNAVVFSESGDVPLIARVCIQVLEYTEDYRRLNGELTPRLASLRDQARQLHDTLRSATGSSGGFKS